MTPNEKKLAAITHVLGLPVGSDGKAIVAAIKALTAEDDAALRAMSERERELCRSKGISPARYLATRRARLANSPSQRGGR